MNSIGNNAVQGLISAGIGVAAGAATSAIQHKYNKKLADYQFDKNLEMWNKQNEYNTPKAQRERLEDAGLNPALAYGGAGNAGNATTMPQYQQMGTDVSNNLLNGLQMAQMVANIEKTNAETEQTETQTEQTAIDNKTRDSYNRSIISSNLAKSSKDIAESKLVNEKRITEVAQRPVMLAQMNINVRSMAAEVGLKLAQTVSEKEKSKLIAMQRVTESVTQVLRKAEYFETMSRIKSYSFDNFLKFTQAQRNHSDIILNKARISQLDVETLYQKARYDYYKTYGVFPDAFGENFMMQLCTSDADGLGSTKTAYFGDQGLGHVTSALGGISRFVTKGKK